MPCVPSPQTDTYLKGEKEITGRMFCPALLLILAAQIACGQIPKAISYQGVLTDTTAKLVADGNYNFAFRLYNVPTGGSAIWSEAQALPVSKGIFSVALGRATPLGLPNVTITPSGSTLTIAASSGTAIGHDSQRGAGSPSTSSGQWFVHTRKLLLLSKQ
jgi:hypothetical protein